MKAICSSECRTTVVCIDECQNGILSGRMYNPYISMGNCFCSTMEFLKKLDGLLEEMDFPQSFSAVRVFGTMQGMERTEPPAGRPRRGNLATFALKVVFRQNASWQGSVTWIEGRREENFRSVLELLYLMDSALEG